MVKTDYLMRVVQRRINATGCAARDYLDQSSEVVVFGSMAVGLDRPDSDIDVLCIGGAKSKLKTDSLDLIVVPQEATRSRLWLQSELTSHISQYGVWIKGTPAWRKCAEVGLQAVGEKRRRVTAFMRYLPGSWSELEEGFRVKYSVKVRREVQRLLLLERGMPVPPTRILDTYWDSISHSRCEIYERLRQVALDRHGGFVRDFLVYVDAHFPSVGTGPEQLRLATVRQPVEFLR